MRLGILDIGTLSLRFDIFETEPLQLKPLESIRLIHRLGECEMQDAEKMSTIADRITNAFDDVKKLAESFHVDEIFGGATGYFRKYPKFAERVVDEANRRGIKLKVLSGEQESSLIADAVIRFFPDRPETVLLLDIGGGSSEISIVHKDQMICGRSVPFGVLVAKCEFPPDGSGRFGAGQISEIKSKLATLFTSVRDEFYSLTELRPEMIVGSSGSARELERILSPDGHELQLSKIDRLFADIADKSYDELCETKRVDAKRADLLVPGTAIFSELMRAFRLERAKISHYSLRHGLLAAKIFKNFN